MNLLSFTSNRFYRSTYTDMSKNNILPIIFASHGPVGRANLNRAESVPPFYEYIQSISVVRFKNRVLDAPIHFTLFPFFLLYFYFSQDIVVTAVKEKSIIDLLLLFLCRKEIENLLERSKV